MATTFQIQVSTGGYADSWFTDLVTLTDSGTGFSYDHVPVTAGQLYIYRVRRRDDTQTGTCQYSDWAYTLARALTPITAGGTNMADPVVGAETELGLGLEIVEGQPVRATHKLEYYSGSINRNVTLIPTTYLDGSGVQSKKTVDGQTTFDGSITVDVTPEGGFARLLVQAMGTPITTQVGGAGGTPVHYRHRFRNGQFGRQPASYWQRKPIPNGAQFFLYPGVSVNNLSFSVAQDQTTALQASAGLVAMDEVQYTVASQTGMDVASVDTLDPFSAGVDAKFFDNGVEIGNVQNIDITVNPAHSSKSVIRGKRGVKQNFLSGFSPVTANLTLYLENDTVIDTVYGTANPTLPVGIQRNQVATEKRLNITKPSANSLGFVERIDFVWPKCLYANITDPVNGPDVIIQQAPLLPLKDASTGTDFYIDLYNSLPYSTIITRGGTVIPPNNAVQTYQPLQTP